MKKKIIKKVAFFLIGELLSLALLGIALTYYISFWLVLPTFAFASLSGYIVFRAGEKKAETILGEIILKKNTLNLILSVLGTFGISVRLMETILNQTLKEVSVWSLFLLISLFFSFFPMFWFLGNLVSYKCRVIEGKKQKYYYFYISSVSVFFLCFLFFQPLEIYINNANDIPISIWDTVKALSYYFPYVFFIVGIAVFLPPKVAGYIGIFIGALNLVTYIQIMFMNKYLGELAGEDYIWQNHAVYTMVTGILWVLFFFFFIFIGVNKKTSLIHICLNVVVLILLLVSCLFSTIKYISVNPSKEEGYHYLDGHEQFTIGEEENIVLLIADAVDNSFAKEIMKEEPDFFDDFQDFTFYTDTCSVYDYTNTSVPQMLYGYTQKSGTEKTEPFLKRFSDAGYRILFFEKNSLFVPGNPEKYISNYAYSNNINELLSVNYKHTRISFIKTVIYTGLPCIMKNFAGISNINFDKCIVYKKTDFNYISENNDFYQALSLYYNDSSPKCFIYQHIEGAHPPCDDYIQASKFSLECFKKYLKQMRKMGVYDNSVIIIAADHGLHDGVEGYPFPTAGTPVFMVKKKGEKHEKMNISDKPVYYRDFQATILDYAGLYSQGDYALFGKPIDSFGESVIRTRVWFDNDFAGDEIRKYKYCGNTEEFEKTVQAGIYEVVRDNSFDFSELDE